MFPAEAQRTNMSIKFFKNQPDLRVARFVMPEVGERSEQGTSSFSYPVATVQSPVQQEAAFFHDPVADEETISAAQEEAAQIVAQAEAQAEMIAAAARDKGLAEARAQASLEVDAAVADLREQMSATIAEISNLYDVIAAQAENDLLRLALDIAKKVVQREVTMDREIALTLARITLERLHSRAVAAVHLNPEDFSYVSNNRDKLNFHGALEIVEDASVGLGGCLVRTEMGETDARLEHQFDEISRGLLGD